MKTTRNAGWHATIALGVVLVAVSPSCIAPGYPLGPSGQVDVRFDVDGPVLYAASSEGSANSAERQQPFETGVTITMSEDGDPAFGAFVDLTVTPPEALALIPVLGDDGSPTCERIDSAFRCTATKLGTARFVARSASAWFGAATLDIAWTTASPATRAINIMPAGIPADGQLELDVNGAIATGADNGYRVPPKFLHASCENKPSEPTPWPAGSIRHVSGSARANVSASEQTVVENAPVTIDVIDGQGAVATDEACTTAASRLALRMDATGETPTFYFCFSDKGGSTRFRVTSGTTTKMVTFDVTPEPYFVRVGRPVATIHSSPLLQDIFTVEAFDLDGIPTKVDLDISADPPDVLQLQADQSTIQTHDVEPGPVIIKATTIGLGAVHLIATPRLKTDPQCSAEVTVVGDAP